MPVVVQPWFVGLVLSTGLSCAALAVRTLDRRGAAAATAVGTAVYAGFRAQGFGLLLLFFVLGSAATRVGRGIKASRGVSQSKRGVRTTRHVLSNGGVAAACAIATVLWPDLHAVLAAGFVGSLAAATADTISSEIGQVWGGTPYLLTTLRRVPAGTDGAVSVIGSLAGISGALGIAAGAGLAGYPPGAMVAAVAGVAGNVMDSVLGATLERRGVLTNAGVNLLCTATGALVAVVLGAAA